MEKERFSLLLLEPGEIYFEDFSAHQFDEHDETNIRTGRLKMCSKSIVFDPKNSTDPIVKIPLKECHDISRWGGDLRGGDSNVLAIKCKQYIEMLEGNLIVPYKFITVEKIFLFRLNYAKVSDCLPLICQLHRASSLHAVEQNSMIATIVHSRQSRVRFDPHWLRDLYERVVLETQADLITPLCVNPGRLLLSTTTLYFQPYNNIDPNPVLKINLQDIKTLIKRRFLLRQIGLQIQTRSSSETYFSFGNEQSRDGLYDNILIQEGVRLEQLEKDEITLQWQNGVISNYEYLLYINSLADRTFADLTQYPVFPWVVKDYTSATLDLSNQDIYRDLSKPVGALNEERLERLKERYQEMCSEDNPNREKAFLYGSHYSAPGLVLFYLVRRSPRLMLCLQNGRFDHPDRMFNCVADVFRNVLNNMSDFKELIPEFYNVEQKGDFLVNSQGINFGFRHDGTKVNDVILPPWAENEVDFIKKLRDALESDYISKNLNHWIDLIFGYKQTGIEAQKADNLFYYLCYEGSVNLDIIKELSDRHALEVQIMEFGQIPKQLFRRPHVKRLLTIPPTITRKVSNELSENLEELVIDCKDKWIDKMSNLKEYMSFHSHKDSVSAVLISIDEQNVISVGRDSLLKLYSIKQKRQLRSIAIGTMPLSSCLQMADGKTLIIGSWDNSIVVYDLEFGRTIYSNQAHGDAVCCLAFAQNSENCDTTENTFLISGSWDCSVRIWKDIRPKGVIKINQNLVRELDHDSHITCVSLSSDKSKLISATEDGDIFLWNINNNNSNKQCLHKHRGSVTSISLSPDCTKLLSCSEDKSFAVIDLTTGMLLFERFLTASLYSSFWKGNALLLGDNEGNLFIWDMLKVEMINKFAAHKGRLMTITVSEDYNLVVTGGADFHVKLWMATS